MLRHSFLIIYRNFRRFKSTFLINLIGLSTGLACALLIYIWVNDELHVDKFHENDNRLYQVMQNYPLADGVLTIEATPGILAEALLKELPEIEDAAVATIPRNDRGGQAAKGILSFDSRHIKAIELYVSRNFFNVFSYRLIEGNIDNVLKDKYSVLLSDELAMKLFNTTENLIGKTVIWDRNKLSGQYLISGIFKKPPFNSTAQFDLLFNYEMWLGKNPNLQNWKNSEPTTYVILKEGTDIDKLNKKVSNFMRSKFQENYGTKNLEYVGTLFLQRYSDKYLYNRYENGLQSGGRIDYVVLFSIIAVFILAIACINFMNLSTAKATQRLKEVGVKKALGAGRISLAVQHLGESMLMAFLSLTLAILLVLYFLPFFNDISGKHLNLQLSINIIFSFIAITLFTGLVAGSYPALYISGFNPIKVLKGKINTSLSEVWVRKGLVVFQFVITIILIVSMLVIYKQIEYVNTKNLGYNKDNVITFKREGKLTESLETFLTEVKKMPGVIGVSSSGHDLTGDFGATSGVVWPGKAPNERIEFGNLEVDYGLMEMLGFEVAEGRTFTREFGSEESKIIFNEAAIKSMGLTDPVGKTIKLWGKEKQIIGVVKNFHFESLYEKVKPCFLQCYPNRQNVLIKIKAGKEKETIDRVRKFYDDYNQGLSFEYRFLEDDYQVLYASEKRVAVLSRFFAGIAVLISCLGLFGLAAFTAERRIKEIGIRKVLGASTFSIGYLLVSDFFKIVIVSVILALPVSYFITKNWLDNFAYRIDLELWYFIIAGLLAIIIAWITVGTQAIKAATANPVEALRYE